MAANASTPKKKKVKYLFPLKRNIMENSSKIRRPLRYTLWSRFVKKRKAILSAAITLVVPIALAVSALVVSALAVYALVHYQI